VTDGKVISVIDSGKFTSSITQGDELPETFSRIYLDHNATTPLDDEVRDAMLDIMRECHGNPSSIYSEGRKARFAVEAARRSIAQMLNCTAKRIVFTGSGSEANNLVIKGMAFANLKERDHIITSSVEHPSVLNTCRWLENQGFKVTYLNVDEGGTVNPEDLSSSITERTSLVTIMTANNETGMIQPIARLAEISRKVNVPFHTDATQAVGKIPVDVDELGIDLMTMSAHKIYGPKGVGVFYIKKGIVIEPFLHGGNQENGMRAGTENVIGIVGLGKAAELALRRLPKMDNVRNLRDRLEKGIRHLFPDSRLNGRKEGMVPNTLSMVLPGMRGESMVMALDHKGVCISSGSACRSGSPKPSQTLMAMGLSEEDAHCTVRISLGFGNTEEEIDRTISLLGEMIRDTTSTLRFVPCR
jgi:cysteine desulfurase NifS